jgi:hypothetical protein
LGEYHFCGHWRYKNIKGRKTTWEPSEKFALSKRLYLVGQIKREAQAMGSRNGPYRQKDLQTRLDAAAKAFDNKYMNKSLDQAMKEMKAADTTVKPRKKRRTDTEAPGAAAP